MEILDSAWLQDILATYGYWAVFLVVMLESMGIPMPGETILVSAAIYAGTRHGLDIRLVILAAAGGAVIGDNLGFWIGREFGERLLPGVGPKIGLDVRKQKLGRYLFKKYGGAIVFFGRFVAFLRVFAAVLAGINRLSPMKFFFYNATGGVVWALVFGIGGYMLGQGIERVAGPLGYAALAGAIIGGIVMWRFYKMHEERLLSQAEREMDEEDAHERADASARRIVNR